MASTVPPRCDDCGKFISYDDMLTGEALCEFEPLSDFGPERIEWICWRCVLPPKKAAHAA